MFSLLYDVIEMEVYVCMVEAQINYTYEMYTFNI